MVSDSRAHSVDVGDFWAVPQSPSEAEFWQSFKTLGWEPETLVALSSLIDHSTLFVDVGAWVGPTTLTAAHLGARVVAYEPDPVAFQSLERNVGANVHLAERIQCIRAGVGNYSGEAILSSVSLGGSGSSLVANGTDGETRTIRILDARELLADLTNGRTVLKIDVEGAEYQSLACAAPRERACTH